MDLVMALFAAILSILGAAIAGRYYIKSIQSTDAKISKPSSKDIAYADQVEKTGEPRGHLEPEIKEQIQFLIQDYRKEINALHSIKEAGIIHPYRNRESALKDFATLIDSESREIMIIGSSLKGLLKTGKYKEMADKLKFKQINEGVVVKFLLTHPMFGDIRAGQEGRRSSEIGREVIESLQVLQEWNTPPENVRLYLGTPTCFAIKTEKKMLLNPYPYAESAYDSPCLIVETSEDNPGYFYDEFARSHFGAWDTRAAVKISDYDKTIFQLKSELEKFTSTMAEIIKEQTA